MFKATQKSINYGVQRLVTFALVNKQGTRDEKIKSLDMIAEAVGVDSQQFEYLMGLLAKYYEDIGHVVIGVLIGLFIAEHELEQNNNLDNRPTGLQ